MQIEVKNRRLYFVSQLLVYMKANAEGTGFEPVRACAHEFSKLAP